MIADHLLHFAARVALRICRPARAARVVQTLARPLRRYPTPEAARAAAASIANEGTCLTRALTVAARLDGARVVFAGIEDDPPGAPAGPGSPLGVSAEGPAGLRRVGRGRRHAHAWVEVNGAPLRATDVKGARIVTTSPQLVGGAATPNPHDRA